MRNSQNSVSTWYLPAQDCAADMPTLRITILNESVPVVHVLIEPTEYIRMDPYGESCTILVRGSRHNFALGAPFLRTVAVLIDHNRVGFCEPA